MKVQTLILVMGVTLSCHQNVFAKRDDVYDLETQELLDDIENKELARFKATHSDRIRIGDFNIEDSSLLSLEELEDLMSDA